MNLATIKNAAEAALADIPGSLTAVEDTALFGDGTPTYGLENEAGRIAYTMPEPVAKFFQLVTPAVVLELLESQRPARKICRCGHVEANHTHAPIDAAGCEPTYCVECGCEEFRYAHKA